MPDEYKTEPIDDADKCEKCGTEEGIFYCENCAALCCADCMGKNYCTDVECAELEKE